MSEWKDYKLGDIVNFQNGFAFKSSDFRYDGKYKIIRIKELKNGSVKFFEDTVSVSDEPNQTMSKFLVNKGDVIFALTGDPVSKSNPNSWVGRVALYMHNESAYLNQRTCKITQRGDVVPQYVFYYFRHYDNFYSLASKATGSASQANISTKTLEDTEIKLPSLKVQTKIVNILSSLDEKIETNRKINARLEELAQVIFKSWFIDFEPFGGKMPADWELKSLSGIANYLNGLAMQKYPPINNHDKLPVLKIKELGEGRINDNSDFCSKANIGSDYIIENGDIIFSWSGTLLVKIWTGGKCGLNQHLFKVTSNQYPKWFYYFWTLHHNEEFKRIAKDKAVTMGHIKREELDKALVSVPQLDILHRISDIMDPIFNQLISTNLESARLSALRDTLLPKLMSSELIPE